MPTEREHWERNKHDLVHAANAAGIDSGVMTRIAAFESNFNASARPVHRRADMNTVRQFDGVQAMSSAYGYGQFIDGTWKEMINTYGEKYGLANASTMTREQANDPAIRMNSALQAAMLAEFTRENIVKGAALGGPDADANVYAFHNLGARDASRFLKGLVDNPEQPVGSVLSAVVISKNPGLYGDGSRSVAESYRVMGGFMREADAYALEAIGMDAEFRGVPYARREPQPLAVGSKGGSVQALQEHLNLLAAGNGHLATDGHYGAITRAAVENFQRQHDLPVTGDADKATLIAVQMRVDAIRPDQDFRVIAQRFQPAGQRNDWMQINDQGLPNYLNINARAKNGVDLGNPAQARGELADGELRIGERGPEVVRLQQSLIQLGINERLKNPIRADGIFGLDTQRAVQAFQLWHGDERITGIADRQTLAAINTQAGLALIQRASDRALAVPTRDFAANVNLGSLIDSQAAAEPRDPNRNASMPPSTSTAPRSVPVPSPTGPDTSDHANRAARLSAEDQKMFDKIRNGAPADVSDTTVAFAVLEAKRNGIPDAERVGRVGADGGRLWIGSVTPGFHASVSLTQPAPPMQDTLREMHAVNQQSVEQQRSRAPGDSDPTQGPSR